jgi:multidrug efflux pump subunit AcrA (membrane-fusion protein)
MKRFIVFTIVIIIIGLIVFTLFSNRETMKGRIGTNRIDAYPVTVVPVVKQIVNEDFSQEGLIVANNDITVTSGIQGPITKVFVKNGDSVRAGTLLVQVFDGEADIRAPISGIIAALPAAVGMNVNPGTIVANIVDISTLKVNLNIGEQNVFNLRVGEPVEVETDVYPGVKYYGRIESVGVKADEVHTFPVQIIFPNHPQYRLKSGMFGKVSFKLGNYPALLIPRVAITGSIGNPQVFVMKNDIVNLRSIRVGSEVGTNIIVLEGLTEGESVILSGQENLKDNAKVMVMNNTIEPDSNGKLNGSDRKQRRQGLKKP